MLAEEGSIADRAITCITFKAALLKRCAGASCGVGLLNLLLRYRISSGSVTSILQSGGGQEDGKPICMSSPSAAA